MVTDLKSLTVMFSALKSFNLLHQRYQLQFAEVLTDNGSEFAAPTQPATHPFERMLLELGIKHRYTRPYRPQTNGFVFCLCFFLSSLYVFSHSLTISTASFRAPVPLLCLS